MKKLLAICLIATVSWLFAAKPFEGPYTSEGTVFYLVHKGGPLTIDVTVRKTVVGYDGDPILKTTPEDTLVVLDPDEKMVDIKYWRLETPTGEKKYTFTFANAKAGVWQLRNSFAANARMSIQFKTTPTLKHGVLFSRCRILPSDMANIRNSYILVPPPINNLYLPYPSTKGPQKKTPKLHIASRAPQTVCFDEHGRNIGQCDIYEITSAMPDIPGTSHVTTPFGTREETVEASGPVVTIRDSAQNIQCVLEQDSKAVLNMKVGGLYRFSITNYNQGYLAVDGFPVIFCPDEETAKAINGSVVVAKDGRTFPHRFQKDIYEWMKSLKKSDLEVAPVSMLPYQKEWLADKRSGNLLNLIAYAPYLLKAQDIEPDSPTFGEAPVRISDLTLLYALKRPYNPYYGNKNLMNRVYLYYFRKWLHLSESGAFQDDPDHGAYCGGLEWSGWEGMVFYADYVTLAMTTPMADANLRAMMSEALAPMVHRFWNHRLSCENQSLHWQVKLLGLYKATGNPVYLQMEHDTLKDLGNPRLSQSMNTGYLMEGYGLDGTYPGISACMLAYATRIFNDHAALPVLSRFYDLMNHTVVREPDGTLVAANGFGHRTLGTWLSRQYDGGTSFLDDILPQAAATSRRHLTFTPITNQLFDTYSKVTLPTDFDKWCQGPGKIKTNSQMDAWIPIWFQSILPIGEVIPNAKLPVEESTDFFKNFNNELVATRKPGYYTLFYTGNPSWRYHYWRKFNTPFPEMSKKTRDGYYSAGASCHWLPTQGLNIFWTPQFGAFVLAHNWNMYTQNIVRADREGNVVDFAVNYTSQVHIKGNTINLQCQSKFLGLDIQRTAVTQQDLVAVKVHVKAPGRMAPVELVEQLPYLPKKELTFTYVTSKNEKLKEPGDDITAIQVTRENGSAILLTFSRPVTVRQGCVSGATFNPTSLKSALLEIVFEKSFDGTNESDFAYTISGKQSR